jgi:hypothetical protein
MGFFRRYNVSSLRVYGEEKSCGVSFLRISDPNRIARFIFRMVFELWQTVFSQNFLNVPSVELVTDCLERRHLKFR